MTVEDSLLAMRAIEAQCDGTPGSIAMALELMNELMQGDSEEFWERFFERKSSRSDIYKELTERFIGEFGVDASFGDLKKFFDRERDAN